MHKYGCYSSEHGWEINCSCFRKVTQLQIYHLLHCLRAGVRPEECIPEPPPGRTCIEFAIAAWTPFHGRHFRDNSIPGHHREPRWLKFAAIFEQYIHEHETMPLDELTGLIYSELVSPLIETFLLKEKETWNALRPFGAFSYDDPHDGYTAMHFHNVYMPESPFADPMRLFSSLWLIVEDIERRGLVVHRVGVDSWINHLPAFQSLYPAEFTRSLTPSTRDNKGGKGWWGQFILRTGAFNEQRASRLRLTRQFDFQRAHCECSFAAFANHIRANRLVQDSSLKIEDLQRPCTMSV